MREDTLRTEGAAGHTYVRITNSHGFDQTIGLNNDSVTRGLAHAVDRFE